MISLILPTYKKDFYLEATLKSLIETRIDDCEIIIIDNSGNRKNTELYKQLDAKVLWEKTNQGTSKSYNKGVKKSKGEVIVLLADDQIYSRNWLSRMLEIKNENPSIGILTAYCFSFTSDKVLNNDFRNKFLSHKEKYPVSSLEEYENFLQSFYGDWESFTEEVWLRNEKKIFDGFGQVVMIDKKLWNELGGFYEQLTFGYEDSDFTDRVLDLGFSCKVAKGVYIHHQIGMTTSILRISKEEEERNLKLLEKRRRERERNS